MSRANSGGSQLSVKTQWPIRANTKRGMLQVGAFFTVPKAILEYVWNSIDNAGDTQDHVRVKIEFLEWSSKKKRRIVISDNARGMTGDDVRRRFLELFGENEQRRRGKHVRGYFGTGKTSFLSIADQLTLRTVRGGKRTTIRITREGISHATAEPKADVLEDDEPTDEANGTVVTIEGLRPDVKFQPDQTKEKKRLTSDLRLKLEDHEIIYHGERLRYVEPVAAASYAFTLEHELFGKVEFVVKDSETVLDEEEGGFSVFTGGARRERTFLGLEGSATARRLWGAVDVPMLDNPDDDIPVATNDREKLNETNPRVQALHSAMRARVDQVISDIEEKRRAKMAEETRRAIQTQVNEIQRIINTDFLEMQKELLAAAPALGGSIGPGKTLALTGAEGPVAISSPDGTSPATVDLSGGGVLSSPESPSPLSEAAVPPTPGEPAPGANTSGQQPTAEPAAGSGANGGTPEELETNGPELPTDATAEPMRDDPAGAKRKAHRKPQSGSHLGEGGFTVEVEDFGTELWRSQYWPQDRVIKVNLGYPSVREAMRADTVDGPFFQAMEYDIAFQEYAVAVTRILVSEGTNPDVASPEGAVKFVSETINRLSRHTAPLFAAASKASRRTADPTSPAPGDLGHETA